MGERSGINNQTTVKIDTERMHKTASALRTVIGWMEKERMYHPESGCGQVCAQWKKDANWLKRLAKKIAGQPKAKNEEGAKCSKCKRTLIQDLEDSECVVCSESCKCSDPAVVYRENIPWCINCHAQILPLNTPVRPPKGSGATSSLEQSP